MGAKNVFFVCKIVFACKKFIISIIKLFNFVIQLGCCGGSGPIDYKYSKWYNKTGQPNMVS